MMWQIVGAVIWRVISFLDFPAVAEILVLLDEIDILLFEHGIAFKPFLQHEESFESQ